MTSFNIYEHASEKQINQFKPTYLYIYRHSITGKLYFGKTVKMGKQFEQYKGSGVYWANHIKKHGKSYVETIWFCLFTDIHQLVETALSLSLYMSIVDSSMFLNAVPENGLGGAAVGYKKSASEVEKMRLRLIGKKQSPETIAKRIESTKETIKNRTPKEKAIIGNKLRASSTGRTHSEETKKKISETKKLNPKIVTEESRLKMSQAGKGKIKTKEHLEAIKQGKAKKRALQNKPLPRSA